MQRLLKKQQGFTLIELLIVIVIIGILALIIVPGLASGPARARDAQRKSDLRAVKNALETYYNDNSAYPGGNYAGLATPLVPDYLQELPDDPKASQDYVYTPGTGNASYVLQATLENAKDPDIKSGTASTYEVSSVNN